MEILKADSYYSISPSDNEAQNGEEGFKVFFDAFVKNYANLKSINLIVDISKIICPTFTSIAHNARLPEPLPIRLPLDFFVRG